MAAAFLFASCSGGNSVATRPKPWPHPIRNWVTSISQHSNGAISRHSPVRVLFTNDVVPQERVGTDASAQHHHHARGEGAAPRSRSRREIVLRAENRIRARHGLPRSGAAPRDSPGVPADTKPFEFMVKTLEVNFDVRTYGLDVE